MNDMFDELRELKQKLKLPNSDEGAKKVPTATAKTSPVKKPAFVKTVQTSEEKSSRLQREFEEFIKEAKI
ncbi:MAG: hypothetical protein LBQ18_05905 [Campylobacteraceae bacterium]|jgi:CHAD domain-containing protein|nr:hypothetical protein [Campylobacteraceae bacterium]